MRQIKFGLVFLLSAVLLVSTAALADSLTQTNSPAQQNANDTVQWSQLGADQTLLTSSFSASSAHSVGVNVGLTGSNSIVSVVCATTPCSWTGSGMTVGDSLLWTSDAANGGNGPVTLSFGSPVMGVGTFVQANIPGQFTAQVQVFNGGSSLGTLSATSDSAGDAVYLGVIDTSGANITQVVYSLTSCSAVDVSTCTDFAIDTLQVNDQPSASSTTTTLSASPNPATTAQGITFTANVTSSAPGAITGNVVFTIDSGACGAACTHTSAVSSGSATYAVTAGTLAQGSHSATAAYQGAPPLFSGSTSQPFTEIVSSGSTATTTTLAPGTPPFTPTDTGSPNKQHVQQMANFTITLTPNNITPTTDVVLLQANGKTLVSVALSSCQAGASTIVCNVSAKLPIGVDSVQAAYPGNSTFSGSLSSVLHVEHSPKPH